MAKWLKTDDDDNAVVDADNLFTVTSDDNNECNDNHERPDLTVL